MIYRIYIARLTSNKDTMIMMMLLTTTVVSVSGAGAVYAPASSSATPLLVQKSDE